MIKIQKLCLIAALMFCYGATEMKAAETVTEDCYKLEVPEMKPELTTTPELTFETKVAPEPNMGLKWKQVKDQQRGEGLQVHGRHDVRGCSPVLGRYRYQGRQG